MAMPLRETTPGKPFDDVPGELPKTSVPKGTDLNWVALGAVIRLNSLDSDHLAANAIWRDLLALSGSIRTFYSPSLILSTFKTLSDEKKRSMFRIKPDREPRISHTAQGSSWVDIDVLFTAQHGNLAEKCMGTVSSMLDADGKWRIWMLRTWLECFDGYGHPDVLEPVTNPDDETPSDFSHPEDYGAIIVGSGQAGLAVAGRLKALGVSYIILDNLPEIGDIWTNRYESLRWHTVKEIGNLPFGHTFLERDDHAMPTKRIGAEHKSWAERYGINVRNNTTVESASWDDAAGRWTVTASTSDTKISLRARNLVLAVGTGQSSPFYPPWARADEVKSSGFKGSILHAFDGYHSAHQWARKRGVVIGSANTAHDVAEDMANAAMDTTMVQRSPTFVFPAEWLWAAQDADYNSNTEPAAADRKVFTYPNKILRETVNQAVHIGIAANPDRFDALEKAGFKLDRFGDIYTNLYIKLGGHYVDIGASERIAKGEIKVKTGTISGLTEDGLMFEDGSEQGADLIVLCTGFNHDSRNDAARILGQAVADQVDDYFGLDDEGEIRALAKPAGHRNLYYHGGDVRQARFFSQFVALQIQAEVLGFPMEPYRDSVHKLAWYKNAVDSAVVKDTRTK